MKSAYALRSELKQTMSQTDRLDEDVESLNLGEVAEEMIRLRVLHTLSIFPQLSPSMLQVGIGTGLSPTLWHPVLERMVEQGIVNKRQVKATNPVTRREQVYTIIEADTIIPQT